MILWLQTNGVSCDMLAMDWWNRICLTQARDISAMTIGDRGGDRETKKMKEGERERERDWQGE